MRTEGLNLDHYPKIDDPQTNPSSMQIDSSIHGSCKSPPKIVMKPDYKKMKFLVVKRLIKIVL
jgi:hypothetical protein